MKKQPNADASAPSVEVLTTVIEQLRQTVHEQSKMIEELNRTICALKESNVTLVSELRRQIDELKLAVRNKEEEIALLKKKLFAPHSEKNKQCEGQMSLADFGLFNEAEQEATVKVIEKDDGTVVIKEHTRKKRATHEEIMKTLPVKERIIDIEEDLRNCPNCDGPLEYVGKEYLRDEVEIIPRQAIRYKVYKAVYKCPSCEDEPDQPTIFKPVYIPLMDHSYLTPSFAAYLLYAKFVLHMPFYRQERDWEQLGLKISRATMANWTIYTGINLFLPVVDRLWELLMKRDLLHCDETRVQVLHEDGRKATTQSYMWLACSGNDGLPKIIYYRYTPTRAGANAVKLLADFEGTYLICDGYQGYNAVVKFHKDLIRCGCWAHLRRKLADAIPTKDGEEIPGSPAIEGRNLIDKLFLAESVLSDKSPEERTRIRKELEVPILNSFWEWLDKQKPVSGSRFAAAVNYAKNQKPVMENYLLDGRIALSNAIAENNVRDFAVGRRNWLFSASVDGATASAVIFSLIETAKANNLRVRPYLKEVITYMRDHVNANGSERVDVDPILPWSDEMQRRFALSNPIDEEGVQEHVYVSAVTCSHSPDPVELH